MNNPEKYFERPNGPQDKGDKAVLIGAIVLFALVALGVISAITL